MPRRERGSGSLHPQGNGKWRMRTYVGQDPVTGKGRYLSKTIKAKNVTDARKQLNAWVDSHRGEKAGSKASVDYLMTDWLRHLESARRSPRTIAEARRTIDQVIVPAIGSVPLCDLTTRQIDEMLRPYSMKSIATVKRYHAVLRAALNQAITWGWLTENPADRVTLAKPNRTIHQPPTRAEVARLIDAMPAEVWKVALKLAVLTGARRGELCALRWSDVDGGYIKIRRSVYRLRGETLERENKGKVERWVLIDPVLQSVLEVWGPGENFILSTWPDGSRPLNPDTLSAHVTRAAKDLGMRHVHLHSLRHFAATEMLAQGIGVRDVAEVLGHADGGRLALQVYGHATDARQRAASAAMAAALTQGET